MQVSDKKEKATIKIKVGWQIGFLVFLLVIMSLLSIGVGRFPIPPGEVIQIIASKIIPVKKTWADTLETVIFNVQMTRELGF